MAWVNIGTILHLHTILVAVIMDKYQTITEERSGEYKEKGSRFIGYIRPIYSREDMKTFLEDIKNMHHKARHHCWAYKVGIEQLEERSSDDGEPSGSAGRPILNQILSANLHNVGIVVVRYFGGTKLGVPGLIRSYKQGAIQAIEHSDIVIQEVQAVFKLSFNYTIMSEVMGVLKWDEVKDIAKDLTATPSVTIGIAPSEKDTVLNKMIKVFQKWPTDYDGELPLSSDQYTIEYQETR